MIHTTGNVHDCSWYYTVYPVCIPCACIGDVYMISYASGDLHTCALFSFLYICNLQLLLLCWLHSYTYSNPLDIQLYCKCSCVVAVLIL